MLRSDHLPNELVQSIFLLVPRSNFAQLALVSRQWHTIASPLLYRHVYIRTLVHWARFSNTSSPWLDAVTSLVLRPSPRLVPRSTQGLGQSLVTDRQVQDQGYIRIQPIDFNNTGLESLLDDDMTEMDTTLKEAEWLTQVTDREMAHVITRCPGLVYLQVSGCSLVGDATIYALASGRAAGIQGLWLDLTRQISTVAWMTLAHAEQKRQTTLHHLDLSYCGFVTDACLTPALLGSLTHLRLGSLYNITDAAVMAIAKHCPRLRLLHLSRCFRITNHAITHLATSQLASSLVYLSLACLNQINEQGIKPLVLHCPHLAVLDISGTGINPMFKQLILQQWDQARQQKQWPRIRYQEEPVLLL